MKLLGLDFDGPLHKANDVVQLNFHSSMPAWQIDIALKAQKRFVWAPLLVPALEGTDVAIVIHSTWRKRFDDSMLRTFLPLEICQRVINMDGQIEGRELLIADDYLAAAIEIINPTSVCVLDDRPAFFEGGRVQSWIDRNHGLFVWCKPDVGLQDESIVEQLRLWSHRDPKR